MTAGSIRGLLAAAATEYLGHGWPVAPGAWWSPQLQRYQCRRTRCGVTGPHAVDGRTGTGRCAAPVSACVVDRSEVDRWWAVHPYALLLPTDGPVSVIEGPAELVDALDDWLRALGHLAPRASAPRAPGKTELFTGRLRVGQEVWLAAAAAGVLVHGAQSWVTLPPSITLRGTAQWLRSPQECGWKLPPAAAVLDGLCRALGLTGGAPAGVAV